MNVRPSRTALGLLAGLVVLAAGAAQVAYGCASCGSGGDDPLILYPNEQDKIYLGLSRSTAFRNVDPDGGQSTSGGATTKDSATLAYGHGFSPRSFATLTASYLTNYRQGQAKSAAGDPSLAARYTLVMASFAEPWLPQVQLLGGYKQALAKSVHDPEQLETQLDVFGSGFSEAKAGVDVWFGQDLVKAGLAFTLVKPLPRRFDGVTYTQGLASRSTVSFGGDWASSLRAVVGANLEQRSALRAEGVDQADSQQLNHALFATQDWTPGAGTMLRLSLARQAAFGANKNTARSDSITAALMRSL